MRKRTQYPIISSLEFFIIPPSLFVFGVTSFIAALFNDAQKTTFNQTEEIMPILNFVLCKRKNKSRQDVASNPPSLRIRSSTYARRQHGAPP